MISLEDHMASDKQFQDKIEHVLFGNKEIGEMGMKDKVDKMYELLIQSRGVLGFFTGIRGPIMGAIALATFIGWLKGWIRFP